MSLLTDVPEELRFRGIEPREEARGFTITLDTAEPWGGGRIEGRVERRSNRRDEQPIAVAVRCTAEWLDIAPQLVGQKRLLSLATYWDMRTRMVPIWLDEEIFVGRTEVNPIDEANWQPVAMSFPDDLPRAFEGTFVSFRWRIEARRRRRFFGHEETSFPLLLHERDTVPTVRIETSPLGTWRLLEWRSEDERSGAGGPCSVAYEERRPEDMPLPGETREKEMARLTGI